jgi:hypothetical protein
MGLCSLSSGLLRCGEEGLLLLLCTLSMVFEGPGICMYLLVDVHTFWFALWISCFEVRVEKKRKSRMGSGVHLELGA